MRGLLAGLITFVIYLVVQVLLFHRVEVRRKLYVMFWLWLAGCPFYALCFHLLPGDAAYLPALVSAPSDAVTWLNGALLYWFLFAGYYQFFNMADNSVGVRSLIELARGPARGLTLEELTAHYPYETMLGRRMERLVAAGFLAREGDSYRCLPKGRAAARLMAGLKSLLRIGPGG